MRIRRFIRCVHLADSYWQDDGDEEDEEDEES